MAAVVGAEVSRTLGKCGLAEVVERLQAHQVRGESTALLTSSWPLCYCANSLATDPSCPPTSLLPTNLECPQEAGRPAAEDPELELGRVAGAMRTFFARLSDPAMLPELPKLQVCGACWLLLWLSHPALARWAACLLCACSWPELVAYLAAWLAGHSRSLPPTRPAPCPLSPWHPPSLPVQVPRLKAEAVQRVLQSLADAYATVHAALTDPGSGYPAGEVAEAVRHTPAHVRTLLGVV